MGGTVPQGKTYALASAYRSRHWDHEGAVRLLERANQEGVPFSSGWAAVHNIMDFESLRDYWPFQELVRPKD